MNIPAVSPEIQKQLNQARKERQIEINASQIQIGSTAENVAKYLYHEILKYQNNLPDQEDVVMILVQFNQATPIYVTSIGYIGYNMVCFHGEDMNGKPMELIQHVQQLNFLLQVVPKPVPECPKRPIGFVGPME